MQPHDTIPCGYCLCGCGEQTAIATKTRTKYGQIKGQPLRYLNGHQGRAPRTIRQSLAERFWSKVDKRGPDDCWEWQGSKLRQGYGMIRQNGVSLIASRVSHELHYGPITSGLWVLHRCDNPSCVNPAHLFLGTVSDNNADREAKGRNKPRYGSDNGMAQLNKQKVHDIRQRVAGGERQVDLATIYGVTRYAIWKIVHRKSWKHVDP